MHPPSAHGAGRRAWTPRGLDAWVLAAWYGGAERSRLQRIFVAAMAPLGWLVGRVAAARRRGAGHHLRHTDAAQPAAMPTAPGCVPGLPPVIVVGNLTVGGTGKTPVVAWLAVALRNRGLRVGLVSRGHGGRAGEARRVHPGDSPALVGDEPVWLAANTGCPTAVGRDRLAAARLLAAEVDVLVADDGLQHHALPRCQEVIVVDATRPAPLGNGRCLPAGPLREPADFVGPGQVVLLNRGTPPPAALADGMLPVWARRSTVLQFGLRPVRAVNLRSGEPRDLSTFGSAIAVAGIGNPARFFDGLRYAGIHLAATRVFPDHHAYSPTDFPVAAGGGSTSPAGATGDAVAVPVLMTAKDAVKCVEFAADHWWSVEVDVAFAPGDEERLLARVLESLGHGECRAR